jgi:uncharacterized protein YlxW (UPF0749 family)
MDNIRKKEKREQIMVVRRKKVYKYTDEEEKEYKDRMDRDMAIIQKLHERHDELQNARSKVQMELHSLNKELMDLPITEMKDKVATRILLKGMVEAYGEIMLKIRHRQAEAVKNFDISLLDYKNYKQSRKSADSQK